MAKATKVKMAVKKIALKYEHYPGEVKDQGLGLRLGFRVKC